MKTHLALLEDCVNFEGEGFLSMLAEHLADGKYSTVGPQLAARMGGRITRVVEAGWRTPDELDWREDDYRITEISCLGATFCLLEADGVAVVRESIRGLFGWLDGHKSL